MRPERNVLRDWVTIRDRYFVGTFNDREPHRLNYSIRWYVFGIMSALLTVVTIPLAIHRADTIFCMVPIVMGSVTLFGSILCANANYDDLGDLRVYHREWVVPYSTHLWGPTILLYYGTGAAVFNLASLVFYTNPFWVILSTPSMVAMFVVYHLVRRGNAWVRRVYQDIQFVRSPQNRKEFRK